MTYQCSGAGGYDPRLRGAKCDECPLGPNGPNFVHQRGSGGSWRPVPSWHTPDAFAITVAEAPAGMEEEAGEPLAGPPGKLHEQGVAHVGWRREHFAKANLIECRCYDDNFDAMMARWSKYNKRLPTDQQWKSPVECCKPRLEADLTPYSCVLSYGKPAAHALTGSSASLDALAGGPLIIGAQTGSPKKLLPTWHPSAVLRKRENIGVWLRHIEIARDHYTGVVTWTDPWTELHPSPETFQRFLAQPSPWWAWDSETSSVDPRRSTAWCFSVATPLITGPCWVCLGTRPSCPICLGQDPTIPHRTAAAIHLRSVEDGSLREGMALLPQLADAFRDPARWWVGHNSILFDAQVARRADTVGAFPSPKRHRDTAMLAALAYPERSKALGFVGPMKCGITSWKADHEGNKIAVNPADDQTLLLYCVKDSAVCADILPGLAADADEMGANTPLPENLKPQGWPTDVPWTLLEMDHWTHGVMCRGLHEVGVGIDVRIKDQIDPRTGQPATEDGAVEIHRQRLTSTAVRLAIEIGEIAAKYGVKGPTKTKRDGPTAHNPNSSQQVAYLLYDVWGWEPLAYTESLDRSVSDDVILEHLRNGDPAEPDQKRYLLLVREYRSAVKALGTFVNCLTPEQWERREDDRGRIRLENTGGLIQPDLRVHGSWGRWAAPGRLSSSENNQQNIPVKYRDQYVAEPGYVFVGADIKAFHVVLIANHWKIPSVCRVLDERLDPHVYKAVQIFGEEHVRALDGWDKDPQSKHYFNLRNKPREGSKADEIRSVSKVFVYSGAYDAGASTLWRLIVTQEGKDENGNTVFPFAHYTLRRVRAMRTAELQAEPAWEHLWSGKTEEFLQRGYVTEPVFGRKSRMLQLTGLPAEEIRKHGRSDIVNWEILSAESAIMRIIEFELVAEFPFDYAGPGTGTGLVNDTHDHCVLKVREQDADRAKAFMVSRMNRHLNIPGWKYPIQADVHVGRTLLTA